ncbi:MAG TPA: transglutaminase domain-containing protein, partial [Roseiflexaceae bacterium]|nr:transglutaminase domain-containing protein [Roseiflexaceae bacterium]
TNFARQEAARAWFCLRSPLVGIREAWQDAFSSINPPAGGSGGFITRSVGVGGARNLGNAELLSIRSARYEYWRAVSFDRYAGRFWQNTVGERARAASGSDTAEAARSSVSPGTPIPILELRGHTPFAYRVEVRRARSDGLVAVGGNITSAGIPLRVQHGFHTVNGRTQPNFIEVSEVVSGVRLDAGTTYTATALISIVDEQSLREAGSDYPAWLAPYLQLPPTLPERVRALAAEVAGDAPTPYDTALAIQSYLRTLPYDEQRPEPPENRDWVDYFLFAEQPGYCDDFASAMVVMLRSQGIPARWVQGYTGGDLNPDLGVYIIRENAAHSWPEVYFPGYGWQRFEPTPAQYTRVPVRPALPPDQNQPSGPSNFPSELTDPEEYLRELQRQNELGSGGGDTAALLAELEAQRAAEQARRIAIILALLASVAAIVGVGFVLLWWDVRGLAPAAATYARLTRLAGLAGLAPRPDTTPAEYAAVLKQQLEAGHEAIDNSADAFTAERYRHTTPDDAAHIAGAWQQLRPILLRRALRLK